MLHGTSLNQVENVNGVIYRAARRVLADVDPMETIRVVQLQTINQNTYDYVCPADLKDDRIIDITKQADRLALDNFHQEYFRSFDIEKNLSVLKNNYVIQWRNGVKTLKLDARGMTAVTALDGITDSTTYTAVAGISSLYTDNGDFTYSTGSVAFIQSAATSSMSKTFTTAIDLSTQTQTGLFYVNAWFGTGSAVTSVSVNLGTSASNYITLTATQTNDGLTFQDGWNQIGMYFKTGVTTGTYTGSITYMQLNVTTTTNQTVKWNYARAGIGEVYGIMYYSKYLFRKATTNAFQETITSTDDSEIINLDTTSYNLLLLQTAAQAAQQSIPLTPNLDVDRYERAYESELARYIAKIKSQSQPASATYYRQPTAQPYPFSWFRLR